MTHLLHAPVATIFGLGPTELVVIAVACVLLFGRRLPEVGRSLGRGIVELKKGLRGVADEINDAGEGSPGADKDEQKTS